MGNQKSRGATSFQGPDGFGKAQPRTQVVRRQKGSTPCAQVCMDELLRHHRAYQAEDSTCGNPDVQTLRARVRRALHREYGAKALEVSWSLRLTEPALTRFLEDEHGDINRACQRVVAWLRWREEYGADQLLKSWPLDGLPLLMALYWPGSLTGEDHEGTPVQFNRFGCIDFVSLVRFDMVEAAVRHSLYLNELAAAQDPSGRMVMIFDLGCTKYEPAAITFDMEYWRCALVFLRAMAAVFGPNYPRTVKALFVTRAPPAFWLAWRTARSFAAFFPDFLEPRLRVFSDAGLPQLLEYMPLDSVPACLGGGNPCWSMLNTGGYLEQRSDGCIAKLRLHPWSPALRANRGEVRLWQPESPEAAEDDSSLRTSSSRYSTSSMYAENDSPPQVTPPSLRTSSSSTESTATVSAAPAASTIRAERRVIPGKPHQRFGEHTLSCNAVERVREMLHGLRHGGQRPR